MSLRQLFAFVFVFTATVPRVTKTLNDELCDAESDVSSDAGVVVGDAHPRVKREFVPYKSGKLVAGQVSNALDHLIFFSGYDKRIRPQV